MTMRLSNFRLFYPMKVIGNHSMYLNWFYEISEFFWCVQGGIKSGYKIGILTGNGLISRLTLSAPTLQNGQTHSNNLSAVVDESFECVWPFCGIGA